MELNNDYSDKNHDRETIRDTLDFENSIESENKTDLVSNISSMHEKSLIPTKMMCHPVIKTYNDDSYQHIVYTSLINFI